VLPAKTKPFGCLKVFQSCLLPLEILKKRPDSADPESIVEEV
jgi:hypothetical protein